MICFFDLDGVITDSNGIWLDVDLEFARRRGFAVTAEYTDYVIHHIAPDSAVFTKAHYDLPDTPEEIVAEWTEGAREAYLYTCPAKPGVTGLLDLCDRSGVRSALVTAAIPELCEAALKRLGLLDRFEFILYAQNEGLSKRNPKLWEIAARRAELPAAQCVVFDDTPANCRGARLAGCIDVGVYDVFQEQVMGVTMAVLKKECSHAVEALDDFSFESL